MTPQVDYASYDNETLGIFEKVLGYIIHLQKYPRIIPSRGYRPIKKRKNFFFFKKLHSPAKTSVGSEIFNREPWKCPSKKSIGEIFQKVSQNFLELFLPALFDLFLDFSAIISFINIEQNIISKFHLYFFLRKTLFHR